MSSFYIVKQISSVIKGEFLLSVQGLWALNYILYVLSLAFWPGKCWSWDEVPYWVSDSPFTAPWTLNSKVFIMSPSAWSFTIFNMEYFQSELKNRKITPIKLFLINILKNYNIKSSFAAFRLLSLEILKSTSTNLPW